MTETFKSLGDAARALKERLAVKWDSDKGKWRPVPCPEDEGQFEAAARRRDAREGFSDE